MRNLSALFMGGLALLVFALQVGAVGFVLYLAWRLVEYITNA
jgi:preprotein translocase subunit Sss1